MTLPANLVLTLALRRYRRLVVVVVVMTTVAWMDHQARHSPFFVVEDGRRIDCGTWSDPTNQSGCFRLFDWHELVAGLAPTAFAGAVIAAVFAVVRLFVRPRIAAVGSLVELRGVGPIHAKKFAATFDARAIAANGVTDAERRSMVMMGRWLGLPFHMAICVRSTGRIVGGVSTVFDMSGQPMKAEIGFWVASRDGGHGYGADAVITLARHLRALGVAPVAAETAMTNHLARRTLEKAEFVAVGRHDRFLPNGRLVDALRYEHMAGSEPSAPPSGYVAFRLETDMM
jgi:RimJ/RimL family protein N-acetyltransferase